MNYGRNLEDRYTFTNYYRLDYLKGGRYGWAGKGRIGRGRSWGLQDSFLSPVYIYHPFVTILVPNKKNLSINIFLNRSDRRIQLMSYFYK